MNGRALDVRPRVTGAFIARSKCCLNLNGAISEAKPCWWDTSCGCSTREETLDFDAKLDVALARLHEEGRYRTFIDIERKQGQYPHAVWTTPEGEAKDITVWCGNDYLGMGQHPVVLDAMHEALDATGAGSGGTRNISGTTVYHKRLEAELADLHGKQEALLFTSAYIANDATLSTLPRLFPGLIIYSDALNHASMIEGVRRNGGAKRIFRHNDLAHLRELLEADDPAAPKVIAFESIYSMDGDFGPVEALCDLADEFWRADLY